MSDQKQLFLFGQALPGNDSGLLEKIQQCASYRNRCGGAPTKALEGIAADDILQIAVGHNHVAFLFRNNRVARLSFDIVQNKVEAVGEKSTGNSSVAITSSSVGDALGDGNGGSGATNQSQSTSTGSQVGGNQSASLAAATAAANRTAKIRRVMMSARRPGGFCSRGGVIVDRARPLVPASSIPEELIAQAQVVLQGKSRDVIVRELQRTNLNVNEAVNNLLSRDDDEGDDLDETSEAYLHEELLSLLDAGLRTDGAAGAAIIDHDNIYASAEGYEYLVSRDLGRRKDEAKVKDRAKDNADNSVSMQTYFVFGDSLEYWDTEGGSFKFLKITAMYSELISLADNGRLYGWSWANGQKPSNVPHLVNANFLGKDSSDEKIIDIETCAWRAIILTSLMRVGSFMDVSCGKKVSEIFFEPLIDLPDPESVEKLHVSPLFSVVQTSNDRLYWRGAYPYNERRKLFEKARAKVRKHVTFETNEITEGSEVRTKSSPIYSAGCVAVNFSSGVPMVGTLMESAWTLNETCRFRVQTPEQYDNYDDKQPQGDRKVSFNPVRKRAAPSDEVGASSDGSNGGGGSSTSVSAAANNNNTSPPTLIKETAWSLKEVVFAKEEVMNDIAVVDFVDGAYCTISFKSNKSGESADNSEQAKRNRRIMRKDDLIIVPSSGKMLRAPDSFQRQLVNVPLPSSVRRIISMTVDNTGFRLLVEKKNRVHLLRMNCLGKLFSDHVMPINLNALCKSTKSREAKPILENYGDEGVLFLRDAMGNLVPLSRNAVGGFREPSFIGIGRMHDMSIGLRYLKSSDEINASSISSCKQLCAPSARKSVNKNANRFILVASLIAPTPETVDPPIPSLMQSILYCDVDAVRYVLGKLNALSGDDAEKIRRSMIIDDRVDGNRNILHAIVMNAYPVTNKDQPDAKQEEAFVRFSGSVDTGDSGSTGTSYDKKWDEMVNSKAMSLWKQGVNDDKKGQSNSERQLNSIEILRDVVCHPVINAYFMELMRERDTSGHTPFISAVQMRAYAAASILWKAIKVNAKCDRDASANKDRLNDYFVDLINGTRPDDSPLFILCYNDTCSFTWTGEEHVNQDIFECKPCGLTGTLCCCTECAYTCHRNHDCKLKKSSPTAYCDCWEKCSCKALVTGNVLQREYLLSQLLKNTKLICNLNSRGEHLLLFLARTVGRQLVEQDNFARQINKIRASHQAQQSGSGETPVPEHDLDPPKFAKRAFELVLSNYSAVKSLFEVGLKHTPDDAIIVEDVFYLSAQSGCAHLDKFVFTLLARCQEPHLDTLLNTLIEQANVKGAARDPSIDAMISRFVRSVIRLFSLIVIISPSAASFVLNAIAENLLDLTTANQLSTSTTLAASSSSNEGSSKSILSNYRAVAISGMLSLVRASLPAGISNSSGKEVKKKSLNSFLLKCRRIFQSLIGYSIVELLNASDAIMAPVRLGMVKVSSLSSSVDVMEVVERYLYSEQDLSTLLTSNDDTSGSFLKGSRKRGTSQAATDENGMAQNDSTGGRLLHDIDESDSDSDSDNDDQLSSRRLNSQGSVGGAADDAASATSAINSTRPIAKAKVKNAAGRQSGFLTMEERLRQRRGMGYYYAPDVHFGESIDSLSSPSNDDESEDDDEDEESSGNEYQDGDDNFGSARMDHLSEGDANNEDEEDEEERELDDEDEDAYFNMDEEEEEVESVVEDIHNDSMVNAGDSNDTAPAGQEEVSVEMMETNDNLAAAEANRAADSGAQSAEIYVPLSDLNENNANSGGANAGESSSSALSTRSRQSRTGDQSLTTSGTGYASTPALNWAVSRVRQENDGASSRDNAETQPNDAARNENRANAEAEGSTTAATVGSQATSTTSAQPRMRYRNDGVGALDEKNNVSTNTSMQLSMCFSVIVKLVDELLLEFVHYKEWTKNGQKGLKSLLELDLTLLDVFKKVVNDRLEPTWLWLHIIMDRSEARLKFGNSLATSSISSFIIASIDAERARAMDTSGKKSDDKRKRKDATAIDRLAAAEAKRALAAAGDGEPTMSIGGTQRADFCGYFLSLLRSHSSENGDDLPIIEYNALKSVVFVVEAYLFHINLMDELNAILAEKTSDDDNQMETENLAQPEVARNLRRFYQRSKSICYSHISSADSHHAFKYPANECLPLSTRSHLLQPEAERNVLFALPVPHRTKSIHHEVAQEHGVCYPTHQSLADPPIHYQDVISGKAFDEKVESDVIDDLSTEVKRPNIIVHSSELDNKKYQNNFDIEALLGDKTSVSRIALQRVLGRWSNATLFMSKAFSDQIIASCGGDASLSILLNETAGYHIRQAQFRQRMEKFRTSQTKDLIFSQMSRERNSLLTLTFRQLNQQYTRRLAASSSSAPGAADSSTHPLLASHKVKVTFRDEPGEGTGVARSFYSAVAEALLSMQHLPSDLGTVSEDGSLPNDDYGGDPSSSRRPPPSISPTRNFFSRFSKRSARQSGETPQSNAVGGESSDSYRIRTRSQRSNVLPPLPGSGSSSATPSGTAVLTTSRRTKLSKSQGDDSSKTSEESRRAASESATEKQPDLKKDLELQPLFYRTSKNGYYTPIPGSNSSTRLNAFRNVGRMIGICLQQMEILPLFLCRHVFKFVLNRPITWFDLAFYDPAMFDSLRAIVYNDAEDSAHNPEFYESLHLTFAVDISPEEGGGLLELKPDGANIPVTKDNVLEYIYLFVEHRLLGNHVKCLEAIRQGVFDVIPSDALNNLTSEDLRLVLCGNQDISVTLLESYTKFSDESSAAPEVLAKYKQWFWSVVSKFNAVEKQDLVFFWTGSPSLPSTEEGFQPLPTIMIRPADDHHLPTANTCISRLYVPLYSCKKILRSKLLLAIKARNFGFV